MSDAIAALAKRFWSVHPNEIHPSITREQYYEQEMRALFEALEEARAVDLQVYADQLDQSTATMSIAADRIKQLEARLDRAVTRGLEQVERIATLEAALREIVVACYSDYISHNINKIARAALDQSSPPSATE